MTDCYNIHVANTSMTLKADVGVKAITQTMRYCLLSKHVTHWESSCIDYNEGVHTVSCSIGKSKYWFKTVSNMGKYNTAGFKLWPHTTQKRTEIIPPTSYISLLENNIFAVHSEVIWVNTPYAPPLTDTDVWYKNAQIHEQIWYNALFKVFTMSNKFTGDVRN
jgi:hypothetical protein